VISLFFLGKVLHTLYSNPMASPIGLPQAKIGLVQVLKGNKNGRIMGKTNFLAHLQRVSCHPDTPDGGIDPVRDFLRGLGVVHIF